jgi:diguanylate cyclase (GGDEF)-like protein
MSGRLAQRIPIQILVIGFVAIVCLIPAIVDGFHVWQDRAAVIKESDRDTSNLARAIGQQAEDVFRLADGFLGGFVERVEHDGISDTELARLQTYLSARLMTLQGVRKLTLVDAQGNVVIGTAATSHGVNLADRDYFRFHHDNPDRETHFNHPVKDKVTGDWLIPLTRRINDANGDFAGMAIAVLDINYFQRFYDTFSIGEQGAIVLALNDGTLLVRRPFDDSKIGGDISNGGIFQAIRQNNPVGSIEIRSQTDGVTRFNSYRKLDAYPLTVGVALEKDEVLAPWRARVWSDVIADFGLAVIIALFGVLLARQTGFRAAAQRAAEAAKTELEAANRQLEIIASRDGLTGLANRRSFDQTIEAEFRRAMRDGTSLGLVMIDIDYFKRFNDSYGHPAGDSCLRAVSRAIKSTLRRPGDLAARYGGEEIAVLLPGTPDPGASFVAEQIMRAVRALTIPHNGSPKGVVTISIGVATLVPDRDGCGPEELVKAADRMLYEAKANGRDIVCVDPSPVQADA